ncbi:MAG: hypothetical protein AAFQ82_10010 [Myxococcota bacterium]
MRRLWILLFWVSVGCGGEVSTSLALDNTNQESGAGQQPEAPDASPPASSQDTNNDNNNTPAPPPDDSTPDPEPEPEPSEGEIQIGDPAPPGPPPELDPGHPLRDLPPVERLMTESLVGSVTVLQWLPDSDSLQFAYAIGGRKVMSQLTDEERLEHVHPWSVWRFSERAQGPVAWQAVALPSGDRSVFWGENRLCKTSMVNGDIWCHWNLKKSSERNIRLPGTVGEHRDLCADSDSPTARVVVGDGSVDERCFEVHDHPYGSHAGAVDWVEAGDGKQYWVLKQGIALAGSGIFLFDPNNPEPSDGEHGTGYLTLINSRCESEDCAEHVVTDVALAPDDATLYFATGAYGHSKAETGALWHAPILADGRLGPHSVLVGSIPRARGITTDQVGNIYVASEDRVRVYNPAGQIIGEIVLPEVEVDKEWTALDVEFGGAFRNVLYIGFGHDRRSSELIDRGRFTRGGLFRVPLKVEGSWASRFGFSVP